MSSSVTGVSAEGRPSRWARATSLISESYISSGLRSAAAGRGVSTESVMASSTGCPCMGRADLATGTAAATPSRAVDELIEQLRD
jgi:hypothetical protein